MYTFGSLPPREALVAALFVCLVFGALLASFSSIVLWVMRRRWFDHESVWKRRAFGAWGWAMVGAGVSTLLIFWDPPGFARSTSLVVAVTSPVALQILVLARAPFFRVRGDD